MADVHDDKPMMLLEAMSAILADDADRAATLMGDACTSQAVLPAFIPAVANDDYEAASHLFRGLAFEEQIELIVYLAKLAAQAAVL